MCDLQVHHAPVWAGVRLLPWQGGVPAPRRHPLRVQAQAEEAGVPLHPGRAGPGGVQHTPGGGTRCQAAQGVQEGVHVCTLSGTCSTHWKTSVGR